MRLSPLHPLFGVEIQEVELRNLRATSGYAEVRALFEEHSLLLFRQQTLDDEAQLALGTLFGPLEDRSMGGDGPRPRIANVSNRLEDGSISAPDNAHTQELMANQLWHTDSTFLPVPALANVLAARVLSSRGGETELASTRVAWRELPQELRARVQSAVFRHRFSHSRAKISPELATRDHYTRWKEQAWKSVWRNPVNGEDALYIASHVCAVDGLDEPSSQALLDELMAFVTRPGRVYTHVWQHGDVLIWDERATVHRGLPWPYEEERTLASVCVAAQNGDGLDNMRP